MSTLAKIILDTRREAKNGFPIKIQVYNKTTKYISLNIYSKKEHWNGSNVNEKHPNFRTVFQKINKRQLKLYDEVDYCNDNNLDLEASIEVIKKGVNDNETEILMLQQRLKELQPKAKVGLLEFFDTRIEEKSKTNESTKAYKEIRNMLFDYLGGDINMNDVTYEFLNEFVTHKLSNGCNRGGVNAYLATIRPVYKEAQRRKSLNVKLDNPFIGLIKKGAKKEIVDVPVEDFKKVFTYEKGKFQGEKSWQLTQRKIKLFKFQFDIGGHDLIDVALLKWSNYKKGRLVFKRHKNRNKDNGGPLVSVKVFDTSFIDDHANKENERLFSFIPDPIKENKRYREFQNNYNRLLGSISERFKIDKLTSKSTRYLFKNYSMDLDISTFISKQIQGHILEQGNDASTSYIKKRSNEVIDKAHLKVIKLLD